MTIEQQLEDTKRQLAASEDRELDLRRHVAVLKNECSTLATELRDGSHLTIRKLEDQIHSTRHQFRSLDEVAKGYQVRGRALFKKLDEIARALGHDPEGDAMLLDQEGVQKYAEFTLSLAGKIRIQLNSSLDQISTLEAELRAAREQIAKLTCPSGD